MVRAIVSLTLALAGICATPQARAVDPQEPQTLQDIEARVRRLETLLGEPTPPSQTPAAQQAIVAAPPPPPAKEAKPVESPTFLRFDGPGLSYALGVYNGTVDGRDGASTNPDGDFELAARVFFEPWKGGDGVLSGLGFGLAATHGDKAGLGNDSLPRYRTPGRDAEHTLLTRAQFSF